MFFFPCHIWDNPSHWLVFFRGVETTNQNIYIYIWICDDIENMILQRLESYWTNKQNLSKTKCNYSNIDYREYNFNDILSLNASMALPGATEDSFCRNCLIANLFSISRLHQYDLLTRINMNSLKLVCQWSESVWLFSRVFGWEKTEAVRLIEATSVLSRAKGKKCDLFIRLFHIPLWGVYIMSMENPWKKPDDDWGYPHDLGHLHVAICCH